MSLRKGDWIPIGLVGVLLAFVGAVTVESMKSGPLRAERITTATARDSTLGAAAERWMSRGLPSDPPDEVLMDVRSSAAPAPTRDLAAVRRKIAEGVRGTYLSEILLADDSTLSRLEIPRPRPVHVYVASGAGIPGWNPDFRMYVQRGFDAWSTLAIPVHFSFVDNPAEAELKVGWTNRLVGSRIGVTRRIRDQNYWIVAGEITIATYTPWGEPMPPSAVEATSAHEVGHFLGLNHSSNINDLMAAQQSTIVLPSIGDAATFRLLYSLPPGPIR